MIPSLQYISCKQWLCFCRVAVDDTLSMSTTKKSAKGA